MRLTSNANFTFLHVRRLDSIFFFVSPFCIIQFLEIKCDKLDFNISVKLLSYMYAFCRPYIPIISPPVDT